MIPLMPLPITIEPKASQRRDEERRAEAQIADRERQRERRGAEPEDAQDRARRRRAPAAPNRDVGLQRRQLLDGIATSPA
jgi:hypothetical protein